LWYKHLMMIPPTEAKFHIGFSGDFRDDGGKLMFPDFGLDLLESEQGVTYEFMEQYHPVYVPQQLAPYDVVISLKPRVTADSLRGVTKLAAIGRFGVGYDNIDLDACTTADVAVFITPEAVRRPMAESIVLFVLALSHNLVFKDRLVRQGRWAESTRILGKEPRNRVLGTIGLGGIASEAVQLLRPFSFARLVAFDPNVDAARMREVGVQPVEFQELLCISDYIVVNCPLMPNTRHLLGEAEFKLMKADAVLINTARGAIVDETALVRALETGTIRGAALDVFETEPLSANSPLLRMDNVVLTSHSIGWTEELFRDMGQVCCGGALAVFRGEAPPNVVNRKVLDRPGFRAKLERYRKASQKHLQQAG
jgi:phosphoglycerate dehydrogenase-like enzyme